jgi:hypothetical protein
MRNMIIIISPHVSPEAAQPRMSISFLRIRKILLDAAENSKNGRYDQSTLPAPNHQTFQTNERYTTKLRGNVTDAKAFTALQ